MRELTIGCAQLGPIQRADSRAIAVDRLIALLEQAGRQGATLVVFPELALTTFFPRWYMEDQAEIDAWFEREMPNDATQPLFDRARELGIGMYLGYAELTPDGQHFNTSILTGTTGEIVLKYRKIHLPGHVEFDPDRAFQHLEKRYFLTGDLGFNVIRAHGGVMGTRHSRGCSYKAGR
jgi:predicted amidohydrolase